jgi:hypothetical protein
VDRIRFGLDLLLRLAGPLIAIYFGVNDSSRRAAAFSAAAFLLALVAISVASAPLMQHVLLRRVRRSVELQQLAIYDPPALEVHFKSASTAARELVLILSRMTKEERKSFVQEQ